MKGLYFKGNEIIKNSNRKEKNDIYRLNYHLTPPKGLLNDPNGFIYYKGQYHLFYQWNPFACEHGSKFWGHFVSDDLYSWKEVKLALAPDTDYERNGCYSGSAFEYEGQLYLFYTGNVKYENGERDSYQCLARSKDGITFEKLGPVIETPPQGYTKHFRDPKIWKRGNTWYTVIGAQSINKEGKVLLYTSTDLKNWNYEKEIAGSNVNGLLEFGYMWECPDFFELGGADILLVSPQGVEEDGDKYNNKYQTGYFIGEFDWEKNEFSHGEFIEMDRGFEFYAPQTTIDKNGRRLLFGWMGMPEMENEPTKENGWLHAMTLPRELIYKNNKIYQKPVEELKKLRKNKIEYSQIEIKDELSLDKIEGTSYELIVELSGIKGETGLKIRKSEEEETNIYVDVENKKLVLDRNNSGRGYKGKRRCDLKVTEKIKLQIFVDNSSLEIFVNDGEEVFTSRIFPSQNSTGVVLYSKETCKLENLEFYKI